MTAEELARRVAATAQAAAERVRTVGAAQYDAGEVQRFETVEVLEVVREARQEAQDLVAYGVMLDVRLQRLEELLALVPGWVG